VSNQAVCREAPEMPAAPRTSHPSPPSWSFFCLSRSAAAAGTYRHRRQHQQPAASTSARRGLGSFAGHEHDAVTNGVSGEVIVDFDDLSRSSVEISVDAPFAEDRRSRRVAGGTSRKCSRRCWAPRSWTSRVFPAIRFSARAIVRGEMLQTGVYAVALAGEFLAARSDESRSTAPVRLETQGNTLTVTGKLVVRQTDFGIQPIFCRRRPSSNVEDDVTITFQIVARLRTPP